MTRISMVPEKPTDPGLKPICDELASMVGPDFALPNLYRVLGRSPAMFRAWIDFAWPLRRQATSSRAIRELMILRGAQISNTDYEWAHHVSFALESGVRQEQIDALNSWQESGLFSSPERAAIRLAEEVTNGPSASAECIEDLKRHFCEPEVVELVLTASFYVCVGRFLKSLDIGLEPDYLHLRLKEKA